MIKFSKLATKEQEPVVEGFFHREFHRHPPAYTPRYKSSVVRSPKLALVSIPNSLSELTGPVFGHGILGDDDNDLTVNYADAGMRPALGERIIVHGRVLDERDKGVPGVLVEIWQANAGGRYRHFKDGYLAPLDESFGGFGRTVTDAEGGYEFRTVRPGPYPWPNGINDWRPSHIHFSLFGAGLAQRLITQMYFEGDPLIPHCPIVNSIPEPSLVDSLVARLDLANTVPMDARAYRFDIVLRGRRSSQFENRS
ncbi:MAG: protocatechuate 3,4-dioxygenase subunit beta [Rhodobacteraceae bacterium]|nr:protocatechuate 3,4-dioxygenase subunit beta [Paracoccaceae bacterium]